MTETPALSRLSPAAEDLRWLLGRGYPRERVLTLVGDRYNLDADDRHVLRRGVHAPAEARARRERLLELSACRGEHVAVDGYNVLITLESALAGRRLLMADDGVVRDISGVGRNHRAGKGTFAAAALMARALAGAGVGKVSFWLDAPISGSGELAARVGKILTEHGLENTSRAASALDKRLGAHAGPAASSDSAVIDAAAMPLDLAGQVIACLDPVPEMESLL